MIFLYDNSIGGFLTCVFEAYRYGQNAARILPSNDFQQLTVEENTTVATEPEKAERVASGILRRTGRDGLDNVLRVFRTRSADRDTVIYNYLTLAFQGPEPRTAATARGGRVLSRFADPRVIAFNGLLAKFNAECHRFLGFTRFRETASGVLYAPIAPDHDILEYVMPHFADRLNGRPFGIFDVNRKLLGLYDGKKYRVGKTASDPEIELTQTEMNFQALWKRYYDGIAVEERKSERRRRAFMPERYWKFLPEIQNDIQ
ncbi:MAG: TIGR03915 family putative DNA repair protein [Clostridiales bacterium]|jgi:probable DNA metabolism protein|nr:TIGR03915 family putative DNA repair protein [Clostridiales bacterium]